MSAQVAAMRRETVSDRFLRARRTPLNRPRDDVSGMGCGGWVWHRRRSCRRVAS
jgi:hypothetical protein